MIVSKRSTNLIVGAALLALFLWHAPACSEDAARPPGAPLDSVSYLLGPDTAAPRDISVAVERYTHENVAGVSARGIQVRAEVSDVVVSAGNGDVQAQYIRQNLDARVTTPLGVTNTTRDADIWRIRYMPRDMELLGKARGVLGISAYRGEQSFSQPYAGVSFERGPIRANVSVNVTTGDVPNRSGVSASLQRTLSRSAVFFVDYSSNAFHKIAVNQFVAPLGDVNCTHCPVSATTCGIIFSPVEHVRATLGVYDVDDLNSLFTSISASREF